jgi:ParB/RepB/Spo0J family partition protein
MTRKESKTNLYLIPVRQIVANTNPRNPLSNELVKRGWKVFENGPENQKGLWYFAISELASDRAFFTSTMEQYDPEFVAWAGTFLTQGQLEPAEVRDNGSKGEKEPTYTLIFGCRRCLAVLYNWCKTGKPTEPVIEARLFKGNNVSGLYRAVVENTRKAPNVIEEARAIQIALNANQTEEEVCQQYGISDATLRNRIKLLELPPETQQKIIEGKLSPTKALEALSQEKQEAGLEQSRTHKRPSKKDLQVALSEYAPQTLQHRMIAWFLGEGEFPK